MVRFCCFCSIACFLQSLTGGDDADHEDLVLQLEEMEEKYLAEKKRREALERDGDGGIAQ